MHFNEDYDDEYFKQLLSEKRVITYKKGRPVQVWKPTRKRNEAIDYTVYNLAALAILNPNYERICENTQPKLQVNEQKATKRKKGFVNGWK